MRIVTRLSTALVCAVALFACNNKMENPLLTPSGNRFNAPAFDKIKTEHYLPALREGIAEGRREIEAIANNPDAPTFENTIVAMEQAGSLLNRVAGLFYNINEADTNEEMQKTAQEISPEMTQYSLDILFNEKLFERVKAVYEAKDSLNLNQEDAKLLEETYKSFANNGANLNKEQKEEFAKIRQELDLTQLKFGENVLAATNAFTLLVTDSTELEGLPDFVLEAAAFEAKQRDTSGWLFTLQYPSYGPFMQYSSNRALKEQMYKAYQTRAFGGEFDNRENIIKILNLRDRMAHLLGYKNYAEYATFDRMAKSPAAVEELLQNLLDKAKPLALRDVKEISKYAKENGLQGELMPWDFSYYSEKLKKERYEISDEMLKPYFKLDNVEKAVFALADSLYGLKFIPAEDLPVYHKDVRVYDVQEESGRHLALLYLDFFPRESKRGGAWMTEFSGQHFNAEGVEERPIVSLVMNFSKPTENEPSLLTFDEVSTFLHEFGHALHGMLAEGHYGSLTGTNVARDFVELPSQIMENWATEEEYLATFTKHYKTGEIIPDDLVKKIVDSKYYLSGYYCLGQLRYGITDMEWHMHGQFPAETDVESFEKSASAKTAVLPSLPGVCFSTAFSHIFTGGYAAGYYSYKWAEVLEADAFELFKEKGIFNKEISHRFRDQILSRGGIEDADVLYRNFRGRDPKTDALINKMK